MAQTTERTLIAERSINRVTLVITQEPDQEPKEVSILARVYFGGKCIANFSENGVLANSAFDMRESTYRVRRMAIAEARLGWGR